MLHPGSCIARGAVCKSGKLPGVHHCLPAACGAALQAYSFVSSPVAADSALLLGIQFLGGWADFFLFSGALLLFLTSPLLYAVALLWLNLVYLQRTVGLDLQLSISFSTMAPIYPGGASRSLFHCELQYFQCAGFSSCYWRKHGEMVGRVWLRRYIYHCFLLQGFKQQLFSLPCHPPKVL